MKAISPKPNTVIIDADDGYQYLQFYRTIVVRCLAGSSITLDPRWDCSKTTARRVCDYLNCTPNEIRKAIKAGQYKIEDLNGLNHEI